MFLSRSQLLHALDWPDQGQVRPGVLTWTHTEGQGPSRRMISASVVVTEKAVACRMRSALIARPGHLKPHVEAVWKTFPAGPPQLSRWVVDGRPRNPRSPTAAEEAINHFRAAVSAMGAPPTFRPSLHAELDPNAVTP